MKLGKRQIKQVAKHFVSALITQGAAFHDDRLSDKDNEAIREEALKIALKLYDGKCAQTIPEVVDITLNQ